MASSIYISIAFVLGVCLGRFSPIPAELLSQTLTTYVLYALIFTVGITVGANMEVWRAVKAIHVRIVLIPLSIIAGTLAGCAAVSPLLRTISLSEALAVGAGFGYYSLSSVLIAQIDGEALGTIALVSNLMREVITLLLAPLLVRLFGKLAPIAAGGATAMDTTLPVISRFSGKEYTVYAIFSGVALTFLVPMLVQLFLT
jgi:uncharacterized membrane protein YbjE (DUF340 family)